MMYISWYGVVKRKLVNLVSELLINEVLAYRCLDTLYNGVCNNYDI